MSDTEKEPRPSAGGGTGPSEAPATSPPETRGDDRRTFLARASTAAMAAGLVGGYGGLGLVAGRYLYPARPGDRVWQFVAEVARIDAGAAFRYRGPGGETVNVVRTAGRGDESDFIALSSICPHLGCQVHWEAQNDRYFCPCHNGTFDPEGRATGGPPAEAGQSLGRYPLRVEGGLLFIEVPVGGIDRERRRGQGVAGTGGISAPGHDRCLASTDDIDGGEKT